MSIVFGLISQSSVDLSVGLFFREGVSLIVQLLSSAKSDLDLDVLSRKVKREGNESISLLCHQTAKLHDLLFVHQKLSIPQRLSVENVALLIRADVHSHHKELSVLDGAIGILQVDRALTNAFDLGAEQGDPRLVFFVHEIIVPCLAVLCNDPSALLFFCQDAPSFRYFLKSESYYITVFS